MTEQTQQTPSFRFRYTTLIVAILIFGQIELPHVSLKEMASATYQNLANVASINAGVQPNEYNTLAQQFSEKDQQLSAREQELIQREKALDAKYQAEIAATKRTTLLTVGGATLVLVLLILANFYFDIKREEERERQLSAQKRDTQPIAT